MLLLQLNAVSVERQGWSWWRGEKSPTWAGFDLFSPILLGQMRDLSLAAAGVQTLLCCLELFLSLDFSLFCLSPSYFRPCCSLLLTVFCVHSLSLYASDCLSVSPHRPHRRLLSSGIPYLIFFLCGEAAGWIRAWPGCTNHPHLQGSFSITSTMPLPHI